MSKPRMVDAPEWANYLAMDSDGEWCWYEFEPVKDDGFWHPNGGLYEHAGNNETLDWSETKERI